MGSKLKETIGDISHLEKIANYKGKFKRITFDEAEKVLKSYAYINEQDEIVVE